MIFILSRGREGVQVESSSSMRRPGNNSILAIEMNVVATSASIAIVISFINKIMRKFLPTYTQN